MVIEGVGRGLFGWKTQTWETYYYKFFYFVDSRISLFSTDAILRRLSRRIPGTTITTVGGSEASNPLHDEEEDDEA
jgi:hypothetical protein